jgi:hypothetical protein
MYLSFSNSIMMSVSFSSLKILCADNFFVSKRSHIASRPAHLNMSETKWEMKVFVDGLVLGDTGGELLGIVRI